MKKQIITLIILALLPLAASADAVEIDGIYYCPALEMEGVEVTINPDNYTGAVEIPDSVEYDGKNLPVTRIGDGAFEFCSGLTSVAIPSSVTSIGDGAFLDCSGLKSVTIPNSITSIGNWAFSGCESLETITIPSSVTNLGDYAFLGCGALTSVTIPNSVTSIGGTFSGCTGLTSITIGSGVRTIAEHTFWGCKQLTDLYCLAENVPSTNVDLAFGYSSIGNATLHVPATAVNAYKGTAPWSNFGEIVAIDGDVPGIETPKCATPTIAYAGGKLTFDCATEGVEYVSEITVADAKKYYDAEVPLLGVYHVTAYATKTGYDNSDVATADFVIKGSAVTLVGDVNNDGQVDAADITSLIDILLKR